MNAGTTDPEAVAGTLVIHSGITGSAGALKFSGSEGILSALGLNTIQASSENEFDIKISDAHTGREIFAAKTTGNILHDAFRNIDVEFDNMAGILAAWDNSGRRFTFTGGKYSSVIHIAANSLDIQTGANQGESIRLSLGSMTVKALGLESLSVIDRETASRSITKIDRAVDLTAMNRARTGAAISILECHAEVLMSAHENITNTESRIRDADMAEEFMQFTKLNIILQAGQNIFSQAGQSRQNVLSLVR